MRPIVIFATLLAIACDTPPVEGPPGPAGPAGPQGAVGPAGPQGGSTVRSGTRLKARVARSPDGASQFLGWWDSDLGVRCGRVESFPPNERCMPLQRETREFADANCTVGAMSWSPEAPSLGYCPKPEGGRGYFPPGERLFAVYELVDEACERSDKALPAGWSWHSCGDLPEILMEDFAAMPEIIEP